MSSAHPVKSLRSFRSRSTSRTGRSRCSEWPLCAKTGHSLAARRIRDVHDVRHRLVNRGALSLVIERESQYLTTDLSPNNRCTHESDFNSSNHALTEKTERL